VSIGSRRHAAPKHIGQCVYCGLVKPLTKDHVPPKCLFPKPLPPLITVPSCEECNSRCFSKEDEYLRDVLICHEDAKGRPEAHQVWKQKAQRSLSLTKVRTFQPTCAEIVSPEGERIRRGVLLRADGARLLRQVERITRALHFVETGQVVGPNSIVVPLEPYTLLQRSPHHRAFVGAVRKALLQTARKTIGGDVFSYWWTPVEGDRARTAWGLEFYRGLCFFALVSPRTGLKGASRCGNT
jgi:hypothetical protein